MQSEPGDMIYQLSDNLQKGGKEECFFSVEFLREKEELIAVISDSLLMLSGRTDSNQKSNYTVAAAAAAAQGLLERNSSSYDSSNKQGR